MTEHKYFYVVENTSYFNKRLSSQTNNSNITYIFFTEEKALTYMNYLINKNKCNWTLKVIPERVFDKQFFSS